MEEQKYVVLNADQKEVVQSRIRDIFFAVQQLDGWVQEDSLTEEMKETLPSLATHYLDDIKKAIGVTGEEPDHVKELTRSINKAREDHIAELEKMIEEQNPLVSAKQQLKTISDKIRKWWDKKGFQYISDITYTENGNIVVNFGIMLEHLSLRYSDTPDSDRKEKNDKIRGFKEQGYLFVRSDGLFDKDLIDCDTNRELLTKLINYAIPSSKICKWENHLCMTGTDKGKYILRSFEVYIYDYEDIDNL